MSVSNSTNSVLQSAGSILRSLDAASNWRALLLTAASFVAFILVTAVGTSLSAKAGVFWIAGLFSLLAVGVLIVGLSAVGFMMMDMARGTAARSVTDALISSVFSIHRLLLSLLVLAVAYVAWVLALALLLYVCKIPGLGATLYTIVFPLGIIISGIFTVFLLFAGLTVIAPSVWDNGSVMDTLARLWAIARERFIPLVILTLLLGLLAATVNVLVFGIFFTGTSLVTGLSAQIIGASGGGGLSPHLLGMLFMGGFGGMSGGGYFLAALIGGGILLSIVIAISGNIYTLGLCINYLRLTDGLDITAAQQQIQQKLDEAKRRAEAAKARAQALQQQAADRARERPEADTQNAVESAPACSACGAPAAADDVFCGHCGTKLR